MNYQLSILFEALDTNSGKVLVSEKKDQNTKTKYYAFQFLKPEILRQYLLQYDTALKQSKYNYLFRQYQEMHLGNPHLHLFQYYEDGKFLDQYVIDNGKQKQSFNYQQLNSYLKQLLIALYELHSKQIPGRIFSIYNILVVQERLVLMDFGFGPDIKQDNLDILAPPECLEEIINRNENQRDFDLKFDSWLLGAILYHLIKFRSINQVELQKDKYQRYKYNRIEKYYEYLKTLDYIPCQTGRYNQKLLSFVESLLTCNKDKRLSFLQIYQHEYIANLQLENIKEYLDFYSKCQSIKDFEIGVMTTEGFPAVTSGLSSSNPKIRIIDSVESYVVIKQNSPSPRTNSKPQVYIQPTSNVLDAQGYPNFLNIIMNTPQFQIPNFNIYWLKIQLDCFKCHMLKQTAEKIMNVLPKYKHPYQQVLVYLIQKMNLIVLREMDNDLKSNSYFQNQYDKQWEAFLNTYGKDLPRSDSISSYQKSLQHEIATLYYNCEVYFEDDSCNLSPSTKKSIEDDKIQNFKMLNNSQEFFQDNYKDELEAFLQFINSKITSNNNLEELNQLKQLIYHCLQITTSIKLDKFQETFAALAKQNQKVQPKDLAQYLGINN
ncbi:unnamed protein product [Paramecium octaurelia]|uniref:Protein kinase domain-containing protein n=1 Tax=Paramecium octaurelia TaxID=43137 RepID=A0A8S1XVD6_PAROT|nr:unnamed protein product [Paramecium octaurelia]